MEPCFNLNKKGLLRKTILTIALSSLPFSQTFAQDGIDSGRILQEIQKEKASPFEQTEIEIKSPERKKIKKGGIKINVKDVSFDGNSVFSDERLKEVIRDDLNKKYDFNGIQKLSDKIVNFYRNNNYPFASVFIPAQKFEDMKLEIKIVEGKYGRIKAIGKNKEIISKTQKYLKSLKKGDVIEGKKLERTTLIIEDLPGVRILPVMKPGASTGQGDLIVKTTLEKEYGGQINLDNHGNRYTGKKRANINLYSNSQILFGDQISTSGIYTSGDMYLASLGYSAPIGYNGLRGNIRYSQNSYEVGKEYEVLDSKGITNTVNAGLSYPLIRSKKLNLKLSASFSHKLLKDTQGSVGTINKKHSNSIPLYLSFDVRDSLLNGGVTYGSVGVTYGKLSLDSELKKAGETTARTDGDYDKININLARIQLLPNNFSLYANVSSQFSRQNLDSSEGFGLGGKSGVRAYPSGEAYGDEGWLYNLEFRKKIKSFTPYVFYDAGRIRINSDPWDDSNNHRSLSGAGLGIRYSSNNGINADISSAWRIGGGEPTSDSKDKNPQIWFNIGYEF